MGKGVGHVPMMADGGIPRLGDVVSYAAPTMSEPETSPACEPRVVAEASRHAVFTECPQCGGPMAPEHAHFRCGACGWRDSCCD